MEDITINIENITEGKLDGEGILDKLVQTNIVHLKSQYADGYITQEQYSQVYIQLLSQAMQQAMAFGLGKDSAEKQAELLESQRRLVEKEIISQDYQNNILIQQELNLKQELELLKEQTNNAEKQGNLLDKQLIKMDSEIDLMQSQVRLSLKQEDKIDKELELMDSQIALAAKQVIKMDSEIAYAEKSVIKMDAEIELMQQKVEESKEQVLLVRQNVQNAIDQNAIIKKQAVQVEANTQSTFWKAATEQAQTNDTYKYANAGNDIPVTGVIGRKVDLYEEQKSAFKQDAKNKALKVLTDTWSVTFANDPSAQFYPTFLGTNLSTLNTAVNIFVEDAGLTT